MHHRDVSTLYDIIWSFYDPLGKGVMETSWEKEKMLVTSIFFFFHKVFFSLKVALQISARKFYKNTQNSSLYSQSLLIFIRKNPEVEKHPITRKIIDLLWPRSTPTGNTVYFYMSSMFIYTLKIHR